MIAMSNAGKLIAHIFCTVLISFCLIICVAAVKPFGGFYFFAIVVGWVTIMAMMLRATKRKMERLSPRFSRP